MGTISQESIQYDCYYATITGPVGNTLSCSLIEPSVRQGSGESRILVRYYLRELCYSFSPRLCFREYTRLASVDATMPPIIIELLGKESLEYGGEGRVMFLVIDPGERCFSAVSVCSRVRRAMMWVTRARLFATTAFSCLRTMSIRTLLSAFPIPNDVFTLLGMHAEDAFALVTLCCMPCCMLIRSLTLHHGRFGLLLSPQRCNFVSQCFDHSTVLFSLPPHCLVNACLPTLTDDPRPLAKRL